MNSSEIDPLGDYLCVGVCMTDPDSGYCLGCGRPPLGDSSPPAQGVVADALSRYPVAPELIIAVDAASQ